MRYSYIAVNNTGAKQKGLLEANSQKEVIDYLRENNLTPILIREEHENHLPFLNYVNRVKQDDIVIFTRQLASMIQTGLTLIEALTILKDQAQKTQLKALLADLIANISGGSSFSEALSYHRDVFSDVYIALVRAAEAGGVMDKILSRLADNLERSQDLKRKVRSALFYPLIVVVGVVLVIVVMNVFVIPQLSTLYEGLNVELPLTTRIVLGFSKLFTTFSPLMIILIIACVFLYKRFSKSGTGKELIDSYKLKVPVIGKILVLSIEDEIARTLSLLISSGTSILESLHIAANVAGNYKYKQGVLSSATLVEKGLTLSAAFEQQNIFPAIFIQMTKVGESTGKIDENLNKVAEYFERDLELKVKTLTTSIEPILLVVLGVTVGFLIISVISPIYGLISSIQ
ncbi:MAG: type II secretion system F family protein [Candidatus Levybacteria bacterium]|nr:type II secretion system F family protein [Candidatus Levybacteria bacterium]MBP9815335.1 type II secretion system F family protein [Candidatus Levybacteria bacterium]